MTGNKKGVHERSGGKPPVHERLCSYSLQLLYWFHFDLSTSLQEFLKIIAKAFFDAPFFVEHDTILNFYKKILQNQLTKRFSRHIMQTVTARALRDISRGAFSFAEEKNFSPVSGMKSFFSFAAKQRLRFAACHKD